jgi:hypothetical protein
LGSRGCLLLLAAVLTGCISKRVVEQPTCAAVEPRLVEPGPVPPREEINVLALSAGGPWGGYGVGFVNGWSEVHEPAERRRPRFDIAVGISTGAIFVTHAFLGTEYDAVIREQLFSMSTPHVFRRRSIPAILVGDSVADTRPLRRMLEKVITPELLDRVADAWLTEGRRLAAIAVDMDCGNPELLDLTALALRARPCGPRGALHRLPDGLVGEPDRLPAGVRGRTHAGGRGAAPAHPPAEADRAVAG